MEEADWKAMEAMHDAAFMTIGTLVETLFRSGYVEREPFIAALRGLAKNRMDRAPAGDVPADLASALVDRLAHNLEEGLTFLPKLPSRKGSSEKP